MNVFPFVFDGQVCIIKVILVKSKEDGLEEKRLCRVASCHPGEKEESMTRAEAMEIEADSRDIRDV